MFLLNARVHLQHFCKVPACRRKNVAEILVKSAPSRQCFVKTIYEMVEKFLKTVTVLDQIQIRKLSCFLEMALFTLNSNLVRHQCYDNFHTLQEIPLQGHKVRVWFSFNARKIILLIFAKL